VSEHRLRTAERIDEGPVHYLDSPVQRALMRLPIVLWRLGLGPVVGRLKIRRSHLVVLTVTGRSSGLPRHTPVVEHDIPGTIYLWCPYGGRAQWYRNVMANPVVTVQSRRGTEVMRAVNIEDDDEATRMVADLRRFDLDFLRSYLASEGIADTPDDIVRNRRRLHLRRLEPATEEGPRALETDLVWLWLVPVTLAAWIARRRSLRRR
jgi:deazaflavin-dependent oxidoreductase (nitroreductase family)